MVLVGGVGFLGAVLSASMFSLVGARSNPVPPAGPIDSTPPKAQTVRLDGLVRGPTPPLDVLEHDFTYRRADGTSFTLRDADTLSFGWPYVATATGLVSLHESGGRYEVAVKGDRPTRLPVPTALEDYRFLAPGPHATAFVPGRPGTLEVVGSDGRLSAVETGGRRAITATRDYFWGLSAGRIWRMDPAHPGLHWTAMGSGQEPTGLPSPDLLWVAGARCGVMHDATTYEVLWRRCGLGGTVPELPSPDGRYAVLSRGNHRLDVIAARTGKVLLSIGAGSKRGLGVGAWSADYLTLSVQTSHGRGNRLGWVTCHVPGEGGCWAADLPLDLRGIWSPTAE
jgi:hypothetical protein